MTRLYMFRKVIVPVKPRAGFEKKNYKTYFNLLCNKVTFLYT